LAGRGNKLSLSHVGGCLRRVKCQSGCVEILGEELGVGDAVVIGSRISSMGMGLVMGSLEKVGEVDCEFGSVVGNVEF